MDSPLLEQLFAENRANLRAKRAEFADAVARIDETLLALGDGPSEAPAQSTNGKPRTVKRRPMSKAARKAASLRTKRMWRERRGK